MSELVPDDDVPDDEEALLDYLANIVEQGRGGRGSGQRRVDPDLLARWQGDLGQYAPPRSCRLWSQDS